jgi:acyl carrier protein
VESVVRRVLAVCGELGSLRGVVHAAGVVDDGVLVGQSVGRFREVLWPKVWGGWWLDRLTVDERLDFFVTFSSVAALLDEGGQGAYPGANAYLDGLMARRRAAGLPGLSINWGPWAEIGMAARLADQMTAAGTALIAPDDGIAAFLGLLATGSATPAQVVVAPTAPAAMTAPPHLPRQASSASSTPVRDRLVDVAPAERLPLLREYLADQVVRLLELPSIHRPAPRTPFAEVGMDSLMVVELRNAIQRDLKLPVPATVPFDHPTVERLADFLATELGLATEQQTTEQQATEQQAMVPPDEVRRLLDQELAELTDETAGAP